jgi:hypothetical protein
MPKRSAPTRVALPAAPDPQAALLLWGGPREILARISAGDPLGLAGRTLARLRARALLVDGAALLARVRALVARRALDWRGEPALDRFLDAAIDAAIDGYLGEAADMASSTASGTASSLSPRRLAAFARLPEAVRQAFIAALVERRPLDRLAAQRGQDLSALGRDLRLAIEQLVPSLGAAPEERQRPGRAR